MYEISLVPKTQHGRKPQHTRKLTVHTDTCTPMHTHNINIYHFKPLKQHRILVPKAISFLTNIEVIFITLLETVDVLLEILYEFMQFTLHVLLRKSKSCNELDFKLMILVTASIKTQQLPELMSEIMHISERKLLF